jgi:hypothetical protein
MLARVCDKEFAQVTMNSLAYKKTLRAKQFETGQS